MEKTYSRIPAFILLIGLLSTTAQTAAIKIDETHVKSIIEASYEETKQSLLLLPAEEAAEKIAAINAAARDFALETCLRKAKDSEQGDACIKHVARILAAGTYPSYPENKNYVDTSTKRVLTAIELDSFFKASTTGVEKEIMDARPDSMVTWGSESFKKREEERINERKQEVKNGWRFQNLSHCWYGKKN